MTLLLGSGSLAGADKNGVFIPSDWGQAWRPARDAHASQEVGIVVFGDSTAYGADQKLAWAYRMRAIAIAAGFTDGGRGIAQMVFDDASEAAMQPDGVNPIPSRTGFAGSSAYAIVGTNTPLSTASGDTIRLQGKGTRIRILYTRGTEYGGFTYSIDGGAAVAVEPALVTGANAGLGAGVVNITGLTEGTHTVDIVNAGGTLVVAPLIYVQPATVGATSGFPAGTYYYKITGVTAAGETTPVTSAAVTTPDNHVALHVYNGSYTDFKLYRSTTLGGTYGLVSTTAQGGGGSTQIVDTGTAADTGVNPPATNTAGRDANDSVGVAAQFVRAAGLVFHNYAISGTASVDVFGTSLPDLANYRTAVALGLQPPDSNSNVTPTYGWMLPEGSHPTYPRVRLAINAHGVNDMQGCTTIAECRTAVDNWLANADNFVRMARAAGADPLIVVPHLDHAVGRHEYTGPFRHAIAGFARASSCAYVDFMQALGPPSTLVARGLGYALHASQETYDREGQFLWDEVLAK